MHTRLPRVETTETLGPVRVYPAWLRSSGFVYLFSGDRGWGAAEEDAARNLARAGRLVVGIDTPRFLSWENAASGDCVFLPGQLEYDSRTRQRAANAAQYLEPVLLGYDVGGTLAYLSQLQAPPLSFRAVVAIDPQAEIKLRRPLCDHPAAARTAEGQSIRPEPLGGNVPARILLDRQAAPAARRFVTAIAGDAAGTVVAGSSVFAAYESALESLEAERMRSDVADLPLVEVPAPAPSGAAFAILYSGDGGWRDLDRTLADVLASKGMSVVGVDVLRYFWREKSPADAARDLGRIIRHYQQRWRQQKVVLIGFSFGADVLPFLVSRLPPDLRADVGLLTLLSPERSTAFEVEPTGWLHIQSRAGVPIAPEMQKLADIRLQCIYGEDEAADSLCTSAAVPPAAVLAKSGGHHFDQNYGELADQILAAQAD